MKSLYFQDQELSVIRLNGELWLRASQIGTALGYSGMLRTIYENFSIEIKKNLVPI